METLAALVSRTSSGWLDAMALHLDVARMLQDPLGQTAAILVAVGACLSTLLGRSVVLAVNRMRRLGLLFALLLNFGTLVLTYVVLGLLVWGAGTAILDVRADPRDVTWAVVWAASPLVLGFATAMPILGIAVDRGLGLWSVLILWSIIDDVYGTSGLAGGAIAVGAWLVTWLLQSLYAPLLARARDWIWRRATGRPLYDSARFVLDQASIDFSESQLDWPAASPAGEAIEASRGTPAVSHPGERRTGAGEKHRGRRR
ncbi:hypothetical protein [Raineyella antarctica]|nr:hypothetical protein [Raineyella antarctica]